MFKFNIGNFKKTFSNTFSRFPVAMIISVIIFLLFIVKIACINLTYSVENLIIKGILTLSLLFFLSVAFYFFCESKNCSKKHKWLYQIPTLIFGIIYYLFFEESLFGAHGIFNMHPNTIVYVILTLLGIIAFLFFAPFISNFIQKKVSQNDFYIFSYSLVIRMLMAIIVGVATMILGFIALSAVFSLFDLSSFVDKGNMFNYWASFSLSLVAPIFFLANLPDVTFNQKNEAIDNKFYSFLINYIGLSAISIYFLILYSYTIKVMVHFLDWPKGEIAWMVIGFSFFGYLIYFASYIFQKKYKIVQFFRSIFPVAVLLQTFMLFYAIFLRIRQYDITINRYLVVVFGLWLFGISLYFIFSKKKYLETIFYSLFLVIIFISIGPWSVYVLPKQRQITRLESYLREAKILQGDKIVPLKKYDDISEKLSNQIFSSIQYLCGFYGCESLSVIFNKEIKEIEKKDKDKFEKRKELDIEAIKNSSKSKQYIDKRVREIQYQTYSNSFGDWEIMNDLAKKIKVRSFNIKKNKSVIPKYFNYRVDSKQKNNYNLNIRNFDYYVDLQDIYNDHMLNSYLAGSYNVNKKIYYAIFNPEKEVLLIYHGKPSEIIKNPSNFLVDKFFLKENFKRVLKKYNLDNVNTVSPDDLIFYLTGKKVDVRLQFLEVKIKNPNWKETSQDKITDEDFYDNLIIEKTMNNVVSGRVLIREKSGVIKLK